jgi:hypothetical protein
MLLVLAIFVSCNTKKPEKGLTDKIKTNEYYAFTKSKALDIVKTGFNAGDGYGEVWIQRKPAGVLPASARRWQYH